MDLQKKKSNLTAVFRSLVVFGHTLNESYKLQGFLSPGIWTGQGIYYTRCIYTLRKIVILSNS